MKALRTAVVVGAMIALGAAFVTPKTNTFKQQQPTNIQQKVNEVAWDNTHANHAETFVNAARGSRPKDRTQTSIKIVRAQPLPGAAAQPQQQQQPNTNTNTNTNPSFSAPRSLNLNLNLNNIPQIQPRASRLLSKNPPAPPRHLFGGWRETKTNQASSAAGKSQSRSQLSPATADYIVGALEDMSPQGVAFRQAVQKRVNVQNAGNLHNAMKTEHSEDEDYRKEYEARGLMKEQDRKMDTLEQDEMDNMLARMTALAMKERQQAQIKRTP